MGTDSLVRQVSLVLPYYENPLMLAVQCDDMRWLPRDLAANVEIVVVDDGSPSKPALLPTDLGVDTKLYRVKVDVRWNQHAARNIGAAHAKHEWLLLTDIDHRVPIPTWREVLTAELDEDRCYDFGRRTVKGFKHNHPNSWLMTRTLFDKIGGYDERLSGWYGTDHDFKRRALKCFGGSMAPLLLIDRDGVPDANTVTYERKTAEDRRNVLRIYAERAKIPDWRPLRLTFPYERVV